MLPGSISTVWRTLSEGSPEIVCWTLCDQHFSLDHKRFHDPDNHWRHAPYEVSGGHAWPVLMPSQAHGPRQTVWKGAGCLKVGSDNESPSSSFQHLLPTLKNTAGQEGNTWVLCSYIETKTDTAMRARFIGPLGRCLSCSPKIYLSLNASPHPTSKFKQEGWGISVWTEMEVITPKYSHFQGPAQLHLFSNLWQRALSFSVPPCLLSHLLRKI